MLDISLIGTGGMMPLPHRHLSSLLMRYEGRLILIDCGEGSQVTQKQLGWGYKTIDAICLTHFHADHVAGLPGLLLSIAHSERTQALTIIGPAGVAHIVKSLCVIVGELPFALNFVEIPKDGFTGFKVPLTNFHLSAAPALHNCPTFAFRVDIHRKGRFDAEAAKGHGIPLQFWNKLQKGQVVEYEGQTFTPSMVMGEDRKGLSVSYITDSRPPKWIPDFIKGSDLFICEGQYGDEALLQKAKAHRHMIFSEAATMARAGNVGKMWLTHFSPALQNPKDYLQNARKIFPKTYVGYDRITETLNFEDNTT
ncbi:MAG: ribonuclease Z [Defluviitaleaceae bacterium]|nr:ribonuclease Z [Defluviitaleaceae bacterium]